MIQWWTIVWTVYLRPGEYESKNHKLILKIISDSLAPALNCILYSIYGFIIYGVLNEWYDITALIYIQNEMLYSYRSKRYLVYIGILKFSRDRMTNTCSKVIERSPIILQFHDFLLLGGLIVPQWHVPQLAWLMMMLVRFIHFIK